MTYQRNLRPGLFAVATSNHHHIPPPHPPPMMTMTHRSQIRISPLTMMTSLSHDDDVWVRVFGGLSRRCVPLSSHWPATHIRHPLEPIRGWRVVTPRSPDTWWFRNWSRQQELQGKANQNRTAMCLRTARQIQTYALTRNTVTVTMGLESVFNDVRKDSKHMICSPLQGATTWALPTP